MYSLGQPEDLDRLSELREVLGCRHRGQDQLLDGAEEIASTRSPILSSGRLRAMSA
jgi:hypothetical protein